MNNFNTLGEDEFNLTKTDGDSVNDQESKERGIKQQTEDYFGKSMADILGETNPDELVKLRQLQKAAPPKIKAYLNRKVKEYREGEND